MSKFINHSNLAVEVNRILYMDFAYVCSIVGNNVYHNGVIIGIIKHVGDIDKVRQIVKDRHGIEFEELASRFHDG